MTECNCSECWGDY